MTPDEHANRAAELIDSAEIDFRDALDKQDHGVTVEELAPLMAVISATSQLAQAHALLSLRQQTSGVVDEPEFDDPTPPALTAPEYWTDDPDMEQGKTT